jgi:GNAT superfamily N-acetyltransferase
VGLSGLILCVRGYLILGAGGRNAAGRSRKTGNHMKPFREKPLRIIEPGQSYEMDAFRPEDAAGIVNLFRAVYGEGYPIRLFYDENALAEANTEGKCYSLVARTPAGDVVGVEHLFRSAPYERLYEAGAGLVLKDYRKQGITKRLLQFIFNQWGPARETIEEMFGEPVCNHLHMQKLVGALGFMETALEVALMPAEAYNKERSAAGRVAALLAFRCYKSKPHTVFLPAAYEDQLRLIYSRIDDSREICRADRELPSSVASRANMTVFDFARVARIGMNETGSDFLEYLTNLESRAVTDNATVLQVWLKLGDPWVGAAVEIMRNKNYFLGGILPRWFDQDGLLMQKVLCEPSFEGIQLHSDWAGTIGQMVREDWSRTRRDEIAPVDV